MEALCANSADYALSVVFAVVFGGYECFIGSKSRFVSYHFPFQELKVVPSFGPLASYYSSILSIQDRSELFVFFIASTSLSIVAVQEIAS